ncbi:MAG: tRNA epoxyqueuosine(34) reductase QueG [Planctomycetaceae bacterium]
MTAFDDTAKLTTDLKAEANRLGFELVGVAPAVSPPGHPRFLDWLDRGYAGEMSYVERRRDAYAHPSGVLPVVKSVVMLGMSYGTDERRGGREGGKGRRSEGTTKHAAAFAPSPPLPVSPSPTAARVASYAWGDADYHDLIRGRLKALADFLHARRPGCRTRGVVDTAPLLERDFARLAGLGWFGKNTLLINKRSGSFLFLAGLLTDVVLDYDEPHEKHHCGTCTRCLDACPTAAFPEPGVLDATKCISYLTIELKGSIPEPLREGIGDWLFGCDVCQDVCPWNRKSPPTSESAFQPQPDLDPADAALILRMTPVEFDRRFRHTPLARPGRAGLLRNAAIVLGNSGDRAAIPALEAALHDDEPLVREAATWALGRLRTSTTP